MTQQTINRGSAPGDGTGDTLYAAFGKTNDNFDELYATTANQPYVLKQWAVPVGIPGNGNIGANGYLALSSALLLTYPGIFLYFPSGSLYSGSSPDFYWTVMSNTQYGTVYDETLAGYPVVPSSLSAIVSNSIGAYTSTTSLQTMATVLLPGGALGIDGGVRMTQAWTHSPSTNDKIQSLLVGDQDLEYEIVAAATAKQSSLQAQFQNRGVANRQVIIQVYGYNTTWAVTASNPHSMTVDTSTDQNIVVKGSTEVATEHLVLESCSIEVLPT